MLFPPSFALGFISYPKLFSAVFLVFYVSVQYLPKFLPFFEIPHEKQLIKFLPNVKLQFVMLPNNTMKTDENFGCDIQAD